MSKQKFTAYFERFTIDMTKEQALSCSHRGDCEQDVKDTLPELTLSLDPDKVRDELREYGAWDDTELHDDEMNLTRIVWIAAGDIREEYKIYD